MALGSKRFEEQSVISLLRLFLGSIFILIGLMTPAFCRDKTPLDDVAERYVKLALKVGQYNPEYVDAYFGPPEWKPLPASDSLKKFPFEEYKSESAYLLDRMVEIKNSNLSVSQRRRWESLDDQIRSLKAMIAIINGEKLTFDEESMAIYRVQAPSYDSLHYDSLLRELDKLLPGQGNSQSRFIEFRKQFLIPHDRIDTLMKTTVAECRERTSKYIELPAGESFVIELLPRQPWGAYNWYKGDYVSLIQIDSSDDLGIESIIGLAAHEGYPGHHVQNLIQDGCFYRDSGWAEYSVQPLFSPRALIAEGGADFGVSLLFPKREWLAYMKSTLCPLAGVDTAKIEQYYDILKTKEALKYAGIDGARSYLDGRRTREATITWRMHYSLSTRREAEDAVDFYERYRSYIITYSVGEDLSKNYIEAKGGTDQNPERRWELYKSILMNPISPEDLRVDQPSN